MDLTTAPDKTRNQSSLDRIKNLPKNEAARTQLFNAGLAEVKRQGLLTSRIKVMPNLDRVMLGKRRIGGGYDYKEPYTDFDKAISMLKANPEWFLADGVYRGNGRIDIYATATSNLTKLTIYKGSMLELRRNSALGFNTQLTSIENVIQTIAHEIGHHKGYSHQDLGIYNAEFLAVKKYRSGQ